MGRGAGIREALCVGCQVAGIPKAHLGPHEVVDVMCNDVKKLRKVGDQDVHHPALKLRKVQLHLHRVDHFLDVNSPHFPNKARAPRARSSMFVARA